MSPKPGAFNGYVDIHPYLGQDEWAQHTFALAAGPGINHGGCGSRRITPPDMAEDASNISIMSCVQNRLGGNPVSQEGDIFTQTHPVFLLPLLRGPPGVTSQAF